MENTVLEFVQFDLVVNMMSFSVIFGVVVSFIFITIIDNVMNAIAYFKRKERMKDAYNKGYADGVSGAPACVFDFVYDMVENPRKRKKERKNV